MLSSNENIMSRREGNDLSWSSKGDWKRIKKIVESFSINCLAVC